MKTKRALVALSALAQESRLAVFRLLVKHAPEGLTPGVIAESLDMPPPTPNRPALTPANAPAMTNHTYNIIVLPFIMVIFR